VDLRPQNLTLTGEVPLDRPTHGRPFRLYVATTNHCNRSCPWCSTCSSPKGSTFLDTEAFRAALPIEGAFEVQLEGGEPTAHSRFGELVQIARDHPRCQRVVVVTNGVALPRDRDALDAWLVALGAPLTLKLSINHYLLARDEGLVALARMLADSVGEGETERTLVLNVRLRRGDEDDDRAVRQAVEAAGLMPWANVFYLQRYGFAAKREDWEEPFVVGTRFSLLNPDGEDHGTDLVGRSEAMRRMP